MILASAKELFEGRGFHGAGMDDIAAAAGVTGPAIYRHFPSKDALLVALFDQLAERLVSGVAGVRAGLGAGPSSEDTARQALEALVHFHVRLALDERALIVVYISEERNLPEADRRRARRAQRTYVEEWAALLRPLRSDLSNEGLTTAVDAAIGLINSIGYRRSPGLPRPELERMLTGMTLVALLTSSR
jgi:AcrR family transcriptional regulator